MFSKVPRSHREAEPPAKKARTPSPKLAPGKPPELHAASFWRPLGALPSPTRADLGWAPSLTGVSGPRIPLKVALTHQVPRDSQGDPALSLPSRGGGDSPAGQRQVNRWHVRDSPSRARGAGEAPSLLPEAGLPSASPTFSPRGRRRVRRRSPLNGTHAHRAAAEQLRRPPGLPPAEGSTARPGSLLFPWSWIGEGVRGGRRGMRALGRERWFRLLLSSRHEAGISPNWRLKTPPWNFFIA